MSDAFFAALSTDFLSLGDFEKSRDAERMQKAGVYALWWTGPLDVLDSLHRKVYFKGKKATAEDEDVELHHLHKDHHGHGHEWSNNGTAPVCMYVGKSSNMARRIKLHLDVASRDKDWYQPFTKRVNGIDKKFEPNRDHDDLVKHTSACQMRAGIEHLFKHTNSLFREKLKHFSIGVMPEKNFAERFYLECLAIGHFRPWFNLDCER